MVEAKRLNYPFTKKNVPAFLKSHACKFDNKITFWYKMIWIYQFNFKGIKPLKN